MFCISLLERKIAGIKSVVLKLKNKAVLLGQSPSQLLLLGQKKVVVGAVRVFSAAG